MIPVITGGLAVYNSIILGYLAYEAVSRMVSETRSQSIQHAADQALPATNRRFVARERVAIFENQGCFGTNVTFFLFKGSTLAVELLTKECQSYVARKANARLYSEGDAYLIATKAKRLGRIMCPEYLFCLVEATYDKAWKLHVISYLTLLDKHPVQLKERLEHLSSQGIYYLVVRGPANGTVVFSDVLYHQGHDFNRTSSTSTEPNAFKQTNPCQVTLGSGAPDGILSFIPLQTDLPATLP